jgi:hypothetical protein
VLIPILLGTIARWQTAGYELATAGEPRLRKTKVIALHLALIFGAALGLALAAHALLAWLGAVAGGAAAVALTVAALAPGGPVHRLAGALGFARTRAREPRALAHARTV